jgi:hypothetical protein
MRLTPRAAALALLIVGCGIDPAPTAPDDPGLPFPEPELVPPEPEVAAAATTTNVWTTKAPMRTPRLGFGFCSRRRERPGLRCRRSQL